MLKLDSSISMQDVFDNQNLTNSRKPLLSGNARVFTCVKGNLMAQVGTLPSVIRINGNIAPSLRCLSNYLKPLNCKVLLFSWCAKDNVFSGVVTPITTHTQPPKNVRRRLRPIDLHQASAVIDTV